MPRSSLWHHQSIPNGRHSPFSLAAGVVLWISRDYYCSFITFLSGADVNQMSSYAQSFKAYTSTVWEHGNMSRLLQFWGPFHWLFLPAIQIRWKFHLVMTPLLAIRSQHIFAHAMTARLSCYVQNFVAVTVLESRWEWNEFPSNLNCDGKTVSETGPSSMPVASTSAKIWIIAVIS